MAINTRDFVGHAIAGAVSASLMEWAGAGVLSRTGHDQFVNHLRTAGMQGLLGGTVVNGGLGVLAALATTADGAAVFANYAASAVVAALGAPPAGAAIMHAIQKYDEIPPLEAMRAGATGMGVLLGGTVAVAATAAVLVGAGYLTIRLARCAFGRSSGGCCPV